MRDAPLKVGMVVSGACVYFGLTCLLENAIFWGVVLFVIAMMIGGAAAR